MCDVWWGKITNIYEKCLIVNVFMTLFTIQLVTCSKLIKIIKEVKDKLKTQAFVCVHYFSVSMCSLFYGICVDLKLS